MITSFSGNYRWLSNFFPSQVYLDGIEYPTVENAYQAAKCRNLFDRKKFVDVAPYVAKSLGKRVLLVKGWELKKIGVMKMLLLQKFELGSALGDMLLATGEEVLVENNTWGDTFWGKSDGKGKNILGVLLMDIREALHQ